MILNKDFLGPDLGLSPQKVNHPQKKVNFCAVGHESAAKNVCVCHSPNSNLIFLHSGYKVSCCVKMSHRGLTVGVKIVHLFWQMLFAASKVQKDDDKSIVLRLLIIKMIDRVLQ